MSREVANVIDSYMTYVADHEGPDIFHEWAITSVVAACLERRVWLSRGIEGHLYPNLYVILDGPPATRKSSSANLAYDFVRLVDVPEPPVLMTDKLTPAALVDSLADSYRRYVHRGREHVQSAIFSYSPEFSSFIVDIGGGSLMNDLTHLYDCPPEWHKKTVSKGEQVIVAPCVNILGCSQPDFLARHFKTESIEQGFSSRFIFVVSFDTSKCVAYPKARDEALQRKIAHTLTHVFKKLAGEFSESKDAKDAFKAWYDGHRRNIKSAVPDIKFGGYAGRKGTHVLKVAMTLSAAESDDLVISATHIERAISMLARAEKTMFRAFGTAGDHVLARPTEIVYEMIPASPLEISDNALVDRCWRSAIGSDFEQIIGHLLRTKKVARRVTASGATFYSRTPDMALDVHDVLPKPAATFGLQTSTLGVKSMPMTPKVEFSTSSTSPRKDEYAASKRNEIPS